ncbi:hypothetical protein ACVWXO_003019 [Bradyrhizobium sp. LM2.7]
MLEPEPDAGGQAIADGMADCPEGQTQSILASRELRDRQRPPRDDSGKVRRTLLRDERAAWMKEGRVLRIMPSEARAHAD